MKPIVDFITNLAPHYREAVWQELLKSPEHQVHFLFGKEAASSIRQIDFSRSEWNPHRCRIKEIRNRYLFGILVWQSGAISHAWSSSAKALVILDHLYILSNWIICAIARVRGVKVAFWGHGIYGNESHWKRLSRLFYLRRADLLFVYGTHAKELLVSAGFNAEEIRVVYNSLNHRHHLNLRDRLIDPEFYSKSGFFADPSRPTLIFVGRLTAQKKLSLVIDAVRELQESKHAVNCIFVGAGPERERLERESADLPAIVHFFGACYDEHLLGKLIANADLCLSPGEVGLTAIHCLSFGTPICTHGTLSEQMPEAEAIQSGITGVFFDKELGNIAEVIVEWFDAKPDRQAVRQACYRQIDNLYNPTNQYRVFTEGLRFLLSPALES